jgi:phosphoenolpyruvate carboxykinase (GTP)
MGQYFQHWLNIGTKTEADRLPRIFFVNWFRKTEGGKFLWPGYGENSRVLKWVFERCAGQGKARETPIGFMPTMDAIDPPVGVSNADMAELLTVEKGGWLREVESIRGEHYPKFGDKLPKELVAELDALENRLKQP